MRVLVTGSRDWDSVYGTNRIYMILNAILTLADLLQEKITLVHGDCPTGADRAVDNWGRRRQDDGVTVEPHQAHWRFHGNSAGPIRNQEMVDRGADLCIGFIRGVDAGTRHTLSLARNAGIPTFTITWEESIE
jgi:SLOG family YspA-like protein